MDKAIYLQHRKSGDIGLICYLHYLEHGQAPHMTQRDFGTFFNMYVMNQAGGMIINDFILSMDKRFNINILTDTRTNKIINFY